METPKIDLKIVQNQLNQLMAEQKRIEHVKERYIEFGKQVIVLAEQAEKLSKQLYELSEEIDPFAMSERRNKESFDVKSAVKECYDKCTAGQHFNKDSIRREYPELPENSIGYFFDCLLKFDGMEKSKTPGELMRYYYKYHA